MTVSGGTPQTFHWEFGTPDNASLTVDATVPGATPTTTHPYPAPGSGESNYTATFTITGTSAECIDTVTIPVVVSGCGGDCPMIDDLSAQVGNCQNNGTREVSLNATITGGGIEQYVWAFGDGIVSTIDATVVASPITVHNYAAPGTYNATLTIVGPQRCEDQIRSITVEVPACEAPPPTPPQPQPPTICGSMIYIVAALLAIAMVATVLLLALQVCPSFAVIQVPQWAWGIIAGLWIAAAVAIIIWYALCAFRICPCPTKCDWAVMVWTATLAGAVIALFLAGCCDSWWWALVIGLGLVFAGAFFYWLFECQPGLCLVLDLLLIVFGSVAATAIAYIALVPIIQACGYIWVEVTVTSIVAVLAIAVPSCHANQGS